MKSFTYVIKDQEGIHARPAGIIVGEAKKFAGNKFLIKAKGQEADLTRLLRVMALGVKSGETVEIIVEGPQEEEAAAALKKVLEENL